ncbi:MAG: hypothetical protein J6C32_10090 [Eubacterium sp.]|nr:hypothetical protein [Eubacterium sp.]
MDINKPDGRIITDTVQKQQIEKKYERDSPRWKISYDPHAAGTDRGNPRDAGEAYACRGVFTI